MANQESRNKIEVENDQLKVENAYLLDELEMAYRQMESALSAADLERQVAYDELRQRNEALQGRLIELESAHRQLQEAQRMLLRAERMSAMGQMAAAIVHEINSPLSVISGTVEIMLMDQKEGRREFETIMEAVWKLRDLARNTLSFSRKQRSQIRLLDLGDLARQVLTFVAPMTKNVRMETTRGECAQPVMADASQVEQVLTNFLINAMDAMGRNPDAYLCVAMGMAVPADLVAVEEERGRMTRLALSAEPAFMAAPAAFVEVRDTGPGIPAEAMNDIFEAFFTTKDEDKGTGLGLSISRGIAGAHGGNILVSSKPGSGTSFSLLLPPGAESGLTDA